MPDRAEAITPAPEQWQRDLLEAIMDLSPYESLVVCMPRQSCHPFWSLQGPTDVSQ